MERSGVDSRSEQLVRRARLTGAMYIPYALAAAPLALRNTLIVPSDAAATAANIAASETLYRITLVTDLFGYAVYIAVAYLFYTLLRNVSRPWAAVSVLFTLAGCFVLIVVTGLLTAPLMLLSADAPHAMDLPQRQELALLAIKLYSRGYGIALLFFGLQWLVMGPLFSRLIPRWIGWLLFAGGIGWLLLSSGDLIAPSFAAAIRPVAMALGAGELVLALWLVTKGVDTSRLASR